MHGRVGQAIEALFPNRLDEFSATLGYHFERAEVREKAIGSLQQAAERAQATFANTEALALYRSALAQAELIDASGADENLNEIAAKIHENIGDIEHLVGLQEQARVAYASALRRSQDDVTQLSRLHRKLAKTWVVEHQHDAAGQSYDEAENAVQTHASSAVEWQRDRCRSSWIECGCTIFAWRSRPNRGVSSAHKISRHAGSATSSQRGNFYHGLALMALRRNRYFATEETIADAQSSLSAIEESNIWVEVGIARFFLGFVLLWAGKFDLAEEWLRDALELTEKTGDIVVQTRCLTYLTVTHRRRGQVEDACRYAEQSLAAATAAGMIEYIGMARGTAWVHLRTGDVAAAVEYASASVEDLRGTPQGQMLQWVALWPQSERGVPRRD